MHGTFSHDAPTARVRRTKLLRPRSVADALPRARLLAGLANGMGRPLILVSGPAGYGKTTLLSQWLETVPVASAWLSLDTGDDDLTSFVTGLVSAVQTVVPDIGRSTLGLFGLPRAPDAETLATELSDEFVDLTEDLILVLDDYHAVGSPEIHEFVTLLLRYPPPCLSLVISTRIDPPLPLASLRAHGRLVELRAADLSFTDSETDAFLRATLPYAVDPGTVALIQTRTEGWIAGLRLTTLSLRDQPDPAAWVRFLAEDAGRLFVDFLADEVVASLSEADQRFLLRTAVPERVSAGLADALLDGATDGSSQAMLDRFERAGLFLTRLGEDRRWFRYHQLFRDLLLHRLTADAGAEELHSLHARASAWFADEGLIEDALRHTLAAGDAAGAADLVERHAQRALVEDRWPELERWLNLLPVALVEASVELNLARAAVFMARGSYHAMTIALDRAEALLGPAGATGPRPHLAALRAEIDLMRLMPRPRDSHIPDFVDVTTRAFEALSDAQRFSSSWALYFLGLALHLAGDTTGVEIRLNETIARNVASPDPFSLNRVLWSRFTLGVCRFKLGDLSECEERMTDVQASAFAHGFGRLASQARYNLGLVAYQRNKLDRAIEHFSAVVEERRTGISFLHDATLGLALALQATGNRDAADAALTRLLDRLFEADGEVFLPIVRSFQARLALQRGELNVALRWLERSAVGLGDASLGAFEVPALTRAMVLLAEGSAASLATVDHDLEMLMNRAEPQRLVPRMIELLALRSLLADSRGQPDEAYGALARAVELAEPGGLVRVFVDLGSGVLRLLHDLAARGDNSAYLGRLIGAFPGPSGGAGQASVLHTGQGSIAGALPRRSPIEALIEPLTERELDVLGGLQRRLSNKEIADELAISPMTVKRHASNLYGKLGVASRRQAIRRATDAGLLPPA